VRFDRNVRKHRLAEFFVVLDTLASAIAMFCFQTLPAISGLSSALMGCFLPILAVQAAATVETGPIPHLIQSTLSAFLVLP
jgi:hypothetical protein